MLRASSPFRKGALCVSLLSTAILSACGGGGSHALPFTPAAPQGSSPVGTSSSAAKLVVTGTFTGNGPVLLAATHRKLAAGRRRDLSFAHIEVDGTLFTGDAAAYPITNTVTIAAPTNGVYTASVPFSNAPVHDNEWAILQFVGVATDGSKIALGETGGLFNVTAAATNSASVTAATTLTLQVFLDLVGAGAISTYDIDNTSTLASTLTSDISATSATTDASTGLFDGPTLLTVYKDIAPKFERDITLTSSPATAKTFTIVQDYTSPEELDLVSNELEFGTEGLYALYVLDGEQGNIIGASGCGGFGVTSPLHAPARFPLAPDVVTACVVQSTNGSTQVRGIYGGHVILGATNYSYSAVSSPLTSYVGGNLKLTGEAVGSSSSTIDVAATQHEYTVSDPAGFAFGIGENLLGGLFTEQPYEPSGLLSNTTFAVSSSGTDLPVYYSPAYSATNDKIIADTFNPWDLADPALEVCGGVSCYPLSTPTTQTLSIVRPFQDPGTKLSYFNWKAGGTLSSITASEGEGYALDFSAAGTGTMSTTVSSVLQAREVLSFENTFPAGSEIVVTAVDTTGKSYSNGAILGTGEDVVTMTSVPQNVTAKSITIDFYVPAAGTYNFISLTDTCDPLLGNC